MENKAVSETIVAALDLEPPPIALAFVDQAPTGVDTIEAGAPSACSFWRSAERGVFYAPAEAHFNCPVGAMVMGFELPKPVANELEQLVSNMCNCDYISSDEPAHIPSMQGRPKGIVYGPLAEFPLRPDVVLCWLNPSQAMIWNETSGEASWNRDLRAPVAGRPACAALPTSLRQNQPIMSFGCIGMRTFTRLSGDRMLGVIPGASLVEFASKLQKMRSTNDAMEAFYLARLSADNASSHPNAR